MFVQVSGRRGCAGNVPHAVCNERPGRAQQRVVDDVGRGLSPELHGGQESNSAKQWSCDVMTRAWLQAVVIGHQLPLVLQLLTGALAEVLPAPVLEAHVGEEVLPPLPGRRPV